MVWVRVWVKGHYRRAGRRRKWVRGHWKWIWVSKKSIIKKQKRLLRDLFG